MNNQLQSPPTRYAHIFFMDGVGMGGDDPEVNPFVTAVLPNLTALLGENWYVAENGRITTPRASLIPTDANLGVDGRPQSATGQAVILSGRNIPQQIGEHYGPKPNKAVANAVREGTLFKEVVEAGGQAALITPYPQGFFDAISSGKRLLSSVPLAATEAGLALMTVADLQNGRAVSPGFTNKIWKSHLGYADMSELSLPEAGERIAQVARDYHFSFFEHWPSDRLGHRGTLAEARAHLEMLDAVIGGLIEAWDDDNGLLIITSDHGNIEDKSSRKHTRNPVPTIIIGKGHEGMAEKIVDLTDIVGGIRPFLRL